MNGDTRPLAIGQVERVELEVDAAVGDFLVVYTTALLCHYGPEVMHDLPELMFGLRPEVAKMRVRIAEAVRGRLHAC